MPALLTSPWRAVCFERNSLAAATTLDISRWSMRRRVILACGYNALISVIAVLPFSTERAHR